MTYTAITIGPIYDTISLTSSPAGLWAASYMFSYISRLLCELIVDRELADTPEDIISPYFDRDSQKIDGIGRYHDRIIFKPKPALDEQTVLKKMSELFESVAEKIADAFSDDVDEKSKLEKWFKEYLQLHAVCFESDGNPILDCSRYLDAIELEKTFPTEGGNPLADLLDSGGNERIKKIRKKLSGRKWPFSDSNDENERLPDMEDITGRRAETEAKCPRKKINSYYAIVQTDGDRFGSYIKTCGDLRAFSKQCLDYCSASAGLVKYYGGIPIYAGGDDLLFIAPLTGKIRQEDGTEKVGNLLDLFVKLREVFEEFFGKNDNTENKPTLSLGAAICYYKYPLYEAFDEAYDMLFHRAKRNRNAAAISLQKHSGQVVEFVLEEFNRSTLTEKLQELIKKNTDEVALQSIREKLWEFEPLFRQALCVGGDALKNVFDNTFDSGAHVATRADIDQARTLLDSLPGGADRLKLMDTLLRFAKFWSEEGDDADV